MSKRFSINSIIVIGGLTRDPEVKALSEGSVCKLRLAVDGMARGGETGYVDVDVFGKPGEACAEHLVKGREVAVRGRLQWREWEPEGSTTKRQAHHIVADQVQFLGGKGNGEQSSQDSSGVEAGEPATAEEPIAA
ncbi:MAG TPA: single-stranded DNA-binding protein [Solirubrobacteraceae bacterium]|jgi:single-strand DNA-binding protein|nr:single-stranded DNA-binding protein [Solirubrobacteraceae bacterium]